ncbi:alanyl-tRNA synthetase-like protein [Karstenula rhodostoma CBS 690.94]|uniref:Alanyl-tRNA synthetase-like protein n=1 Tax=Karstenula rhodostoma CBS 690.94 TaxID=1392251 RepID=A0A9P4U9Q0_9PLEO|nr:alanyl-tRNA synthetase-like protein [Karstenula rhodostoma CBS 690.94]
MADQKTDPLYHREGHLHTHTTTLSSITPLSSLPAATQPLFKPPPDKEPYILTTPSTIFHAQGGGQPSDTGTITLTSPTPSGNDPKFAVHQVRKVSAAILHLGTFEPADPRFTPAELGLPVRQAVDVPTRALHSRLHTAGHVLGLAIHLLSRAGEAGLPKDLRDGKASHYPGAAFVENIGLIPGDAKAAIQDKVDELVRLDLVVAIHFWSGAEAGVKCISGLDGAAVAEGEEVRVVDVGGLGSYPCGGTHVRTLGELGRVVVRNIKRQKGISKVSYEVVDA